MKLTYSLLLSGLLLSALDGCKADLTNPEPIKPPTQNLTGDVTSIGTPEGNAVSKTIGPEGGAIATPDGRVQLVLPAGALTKATTISIQPITNEAPNGIGRAYRFSPDGTQFAKPATLTIQYDGANVTMNKPDAFGVAYQRENKVWYQVDGATVDTTKRQVTVPMEHFSDWSIWELLSMNTMRIDNKNGNFDGLLDYNESVDLYVNELNVSTDESNDAISKSISSIRKVGKWKVLGEGKLKTDEWKATYTAPNTKPKTNPVTIVVEVELKKKAQTVQLLREVYIGAGLMVVTFRGKKHVYADMELHDQTIPWEISGGDTAEDYIYIHLVDRGPGEYKFGPWYGQKSGTSSIRFQDGDKDYASDKGWCMEKGNYEFPAAGTVILEEHIPGKYLKGRFSGQLVDMDEEACINTGPAVTGHFIIGRKN